MPRLPRFAEGCGLYGLDVGIDGVGAEDLGEGEGWSAFERRDGMGFGSQEVLLVSKLFSPLGLCSDQYSISNRAS